MDWNIILPELAAVVVAALILERALAVPFEWGPIHDLLKRFKLRAPIAYVVAYLICISAKLDLVVAMSKEPGGEFSEISIGAFVTAAVIAGGSKGAILLFQGVFGFGRDAVAARLELRDLQAAGRVPVRNASARNPAGDTTSPDRAASRRPWWQT